MGSRDWGMGIGEWGVGNEESGKNPPRPNPHSPIPNSEDELQRELQLPRRAGVAGRESGAVGYVDEPKGCASHHGDTPRLPKVRMVEEVEDLSPELDTQILVNPGVLEDREIRVFEVWSGDDISAQVAEVEDAAARYRQRKDRAGSTETGGGRNCDPRIADCVREPQVGADFADYVDRADQVWSERHRPGETVDVGDDVDRIATLQLGDAGKLPAFDQAIAFKGQFVKQVDDEPVASVEIRHPTIPTEVEAVLYDHALCVERIVVDGFREGVRGVELKPARESLVRRDPQRVVVGIARAVVIEDIAELCAGQNRAIA